MLDRATIRTLSESVSTPCYLFDEEEVVHRVDHLRSSLPGNTLLCYAMKANSFILDAVATSLPYIEVCSPGEYATCATLGIADEKLVISGVYKDEDFIEELVCHHPGIHRFTVESPAQFRLLSSLAQKHGRELPVLLRLSSGNQFGMDPEDLMGIAGSLGQHPLVRLCGLQYFSGTQKSSRKRFARELSMLDATIARLADMCGNDALELEYGPGLPFDYTLEESVQAEGQELLEALNAALQDMQFQGRVILEIGRFVAASCGTYLTRVVDLKQNHGLNYAIVDGGKHQLVYYGPSLALQSPAFYTLQDRSDEEVQTWNVCGALCSINDVLLKQVSVPSFQTGDCLVFPNVGAYCMTEGMALFLSRDLPRIYLHKGGSELRLVRDRIETAAFNTPNMDI